MLNAPPEILQNIFFFAVSDTLVGPPKDLPNFHLICKASLSALTGDSDHDTTPSVFYANLFAQKFDIRTPIRRLGRTEVTSNAREELRRRFIALRCFQRNQWDECPLTDALWIAYLMLRDSDSSQKNVKQILWAGVPNFIDNFVRRTLKGGGWPVHDEAISLSLAIMWLLSSCASVIREPQGSRDELQDLLAPYVFAAFRYPLAHVPEYLFDVKKTEYDPIPGTSSSTVASSYPPASPPPRDVRYFGAETQKVDVPSLYVHAALLYFTRYEAKIRAYPDHITTVKNKGRDQVPEGPVYEDIEHYVSHCRTRYPEIPSDDGEPPALIGSNYKLGDLTGLWQGSWIVSRMEVYQQLGDTSDPPPNLPVISQTPLYLTLQEHYCLDMDSVVPSDKPENGTANAWLPEGCQLNHHSVSRRVPGVVKNKLIPNGIEICNESGSFRKIYQTYRPGETSIDVSRRVVDIIITGKTDEQHAAAWGAYHVRGRVRQADGLVMMLRESLAGLGDSLLRGYVTPSETLIGRMGGLSTGLAPAGWEATFSLNKDVIRGLPMRAAP
ncbi:hypothetical protein BDN72DRAFT_765393 [Pluteus cervinus]|uniref:Uncharacterized protein n=1 Tax=Pluteus cervinus TaxID=181527 RepID=A0ACD3AZY9_9AGAR|nr:hypothetical protein BDN72DRAFT_765393 [Pluteus cervinus]